ncbi:uncharacterized protein [Elaeis guineensis]|uniref:uncharacterized protein n=1 Tax=Elaeis guineensis var. tenera TaxID=51953 RepID=UPI003C6CF084
MCGFTKISSDYYEPLHRNEDIPVQSALNLCYCPTSPPASLLRLQASRPPFLASSSSPERGEAPSPSIEKDQRRGNSVGGDCKVLKIGRVFFPCQVWIPSSKWSLLRLELSSCEQ